MMPKFDSRDAIPRRLAVAAVNKLRDFHAIQGPPFEPHDLVKSLEVNLDYCSLKKAEGVTYYGPAGYFIELSTLTSITKGSLRRQRFTLAHELGHVVFEMIRDRNTQNKKIGMLGTNGISLSYGYLERFCDLFAAEYLMPASTFARLARDVPRDLVGLEELADMFATTIMACMNRVVDTGVWPHSLMKFLFARNNQSEIVSFNAQPLSNGLKGLRLDYIIQGRSREILKILNEMEDDAYESLRLEPISSFQQDDSRYNFILGKFPSFGLGMLIPLTA
ncbi:MAG: ImmA/IrrE family metallo-endopeptidase [bacterium]|jgi:Zn-dependent peptidase ImmA (M78 family)